MKYSILLFDLDDTLLDFKANERESLAKLFKVNGYELTEEVTTTYKEVNKKLWDAYAEGTLPLREVLDTRFSNTLELFDYAIDGVAWEKQYREYLGEGAQHMEGVVEVCEKLAKTHRLFIATNGVRRTQEKRLALAGLSHYFEGVYDSESIGHQKPSTTFFEHLKTHIKDFDPSKTLMIGDSLKADILGGNNAGLATCWITQSEEDAEIKSTYKISQLKQLLSIV